MKINHVPFLFFLAPVSAQALSLGEMASAAAADLDRVPAFISISFYILGVVIAGVGLVRLKRHVDHPQATTIGSGIVALIIGAALIAAPAVINAIGETFGAPSGVGLTRPLLN